MLKRGPLNIWGCLKGRAGKGHAGKGRADKGHADKDVGIYAAGAEVVMTCLRAHVSQR